MSKVQSVDLAWYKTEPGVLALGKHAVSDEGVIAAALRDNVAPRTYCLMTYRLNPRGDIETEVGASFSTEGVRRVETNCSSGLTLAVTDTDLSFMKTSSLLIDRTTYQPGRGMIFIDVALAVADPRRTFAILSMSRDGESYTLSAAEGGDSLVSLWTKTWPNAITAVAISANGSWIAVGLVNGVAALLDRTRQIAWECLPDDQNNPSPIASISVDNDGGVASVNDDGEVRRHDATDGVVLWRYRLLHPMQSRMAKVQTSLFNVAVDSESRVVAATALYYGAPTPQSQLVESHYTLLDGESGACAWHDDLDSPATGVAVSPNGRYVALSTRDGNLTTLGVKVREETGLMSTGHEFAMAQTLYEEARAAVDWGQIYPAAPLLEEALRLNPTNPSATILFDDVVWHIREETMATTTEVSEESLEKVEAALRVAPHDEKLTIRRNALARLVAEKMCAEAADLVNEGRDEDALVVLKRALSLDRHNVDFRIALKNFQDRYVGRLYQESQAYLGKQMHAEAIELLEKVQSLRPDEPGVEQRLAYCRAAQAFKLGIQHYNLKHYPLAIFQFKKTLMLQPGHVEAERYLNLALNPDAAAAASKKLRPPSEPAGAKQLTPSRVTSPIGGRPRDGR